jgi:hypothetical protein
MREVSAANYSNMHSNQPTIILGNGPSLTKIKGHEEEIRDRFVTIGMNTSWQIMMTQYHAIMFHYEHLEDLKKKKWEPKGVTLWTYKHYSEMWVREVDIGNVIYVEAVADPQSDMHEFNSAGMLSLDVSECSYADMTGQFALEIALYMRCNPIYLIGFDLYGGHFNDKLKPEDEWREIQIEFMDISAAQIRKDWSDIKVYNLNPESAVEGFEKLEFEDVIGK